MTWPQPDGRLRSQHRHEEQSKIEAMFLKTKAFDKRDLA